MLERNARTAAIAQAANRNISLQQVALQQRRRRAAKRPPAKSF
jgi:hypothetical protein